MRLSKVIVSSENKSQSDWEINPLLQSPSDWAAATFEIAGVEMNQTPTTKLNALVRAAKSIYLEFNKDILPGLKKIGKGETQIGGDDILPIFIFIICRSKMKRPLLYKEIIVQMANPDLLSGECGYYVTVFEAALEYLRALPIKGDDEDMSFEEFLESLNTL